MKQSSFSLQMRLSSPKLDCFAEPVIGRAFARPDRNDGEGHCAPYFPTHFGGRFSENAFGPSI
jgi:hypothetical protein